MPIVGGSHDPLLEWALRESGSGLATLPEGSEAGLARFEQGGIVGSSIHLHSLTDENDANVWRSGRAEPERSSCSCRCCIAPT